MISLERARFYTLLEFWARLPRGALVYLLTPNESSTSQQGATLLVLPK